MTVEYVTGRSTQGGGPRYLSGRRIDPGEAFWSGVGDTFTFGFGDELAGLFGGDRARDRMRETLELAQQQQGGWTLAGQLGGGVLGGGLLGGAGRAAFGNAMRNGASVLSRIGPLGRIGLSAAGGAGGAALYGAGNAQEDRLQGALNWALPGAIGGGAFRAAGELVGPIFSRAMRGSSPDAVSANLLGEVMRRENITDEQLSANLGRMAQMNRGGTLYDALGESGQHATRGLVARPSAGRRVLGEALEDRTNTAATRAAQDIHQTLADQSLPQNAVSAIQALQTIQERQAGPLYERAWREIGRVNPRQMREAVGEVMRRNPDIFDPALRRAQRLSLSETGQVLGDEGDPRFWHYMLQGAQSELGERLRAGRLGVLGGFQGPEAALYTRAVNQFNTIIRRQLGATFREAQDTFSGAARAQEAVQRGYEAVSTNLNSLALGELRQWFRRATPGERQHMRLGAVNRLQDMLANADTGTGGADAVRSILRSDGQRTMLRQLFGGEDGLEELLGRLGHDRQLFQNAARSGVNFNSITASSLEAIDSIRRNITPPTSPQGIVARLVAPDLRKMAEQQEEAVADNFLRMMATPARDAWLGMGQSGGAGPWARQIGLLDRARRERDRLISYRPREAIEALLGSGLYGGAGTAAMGPG